VAWPGSARQAIGNEGVGGTIKNTIGAIGYVEYGLASRLGMPMAALENQEGKFVHPEPSAAQAALASAPMPENFRVFIPDPAGKDSYPIVTYTWILAYREHSDRKKAEACKQFLIWCLSEGQNVNESLGFVALPPGIAKDVIQAIDKLPTT
jgi:phosphate transport system substrate-binding protein